MEPDLGPQGASTAGRCSWPLHSRALIRSNAQGGLHACSHGRCFVSPRFAVPRGTANRGETTSPRRGRRSPVTLREWLLLVGGLFGLVQGAVVCLRALGLLPPNSFWDAVCMSKPSNM